MIQLQSIREKLSWQVVLFVLLYIVSAVILVAVYLPTRNKVVELEAKLVQLERQEQNLLRIVETRPTLEATEREVEGRLLELSRKIPSQYDLPDVLERITEISTRAGLNVDSLEHVPLRASSGKSSGVIPLSFTLQGSDTVYEGILQIRQAFPSLKITDVSLVYFAR